MNEPRHDLAELDNLMNELARLEAQYPHGSAARTDSLDAYIRAKRAEVEALQARHDRPGGP